MVSNLCWVEIKNMSNLIPRTCFKWKVPKDYLISVGKYPLKNKAFRFTLVILSVAMFVIIFGIVFTLKEPSITPSIFLDAILAAVSMAIIVPLIFICFVARPQSVYFQDVRILITSSPYQHRQFPRYCRHPNLTEVYNGKDDRTKKKTRIRKYI